MLAAFFSGFVFRLDVTQHNIQDSNVDIQLLITKA